MGRRELSTSKPLEPLGERDRLGGGVRQCQGPREGKRPRKRGERQQKTETEGQGGVGADRQTDRMMEDVGSGMGSKERPREGLSLRKREPESREEEALEGGTSVYGVFCSHMPP